MLSECTVAACLRHSTTTARDSVICAENSVYGLNDGVIYYVIRDPKAGLINRDTSS
jgi:hypothetical protein